MNVTNIPLRKCLKDRVSGDKVDADMSLLGMGRHSIYIVHIHKVLLFSVVFAQHMLYKHNTVRLLLFLGPSTHNLNVAVT